MRTFLVILSFICSAPVLAQHKYVYATESKDYKVYIDTNIKKVNNLYFVWEKWILKNDSVKVKGFIHNEDKDYSKYLYSVIKGIYDLSKEKNKSIDAIDYDYNGNVIDAFDNENTKWNFVVPETVGYSVMEKIKSIKGKKHK